MLKAVRAISVLVVDDEPLAARAAERLLSTDVGVAVHLCFDPTDAVRQAERLSPTVILLDMVMPGCDGLTLLRAFRANVPTRDIPIVVLSSEEEPQVKAAAFAAGADDYMVKLPDAIEMVARVRHHARHHIRGVEHDEAVLALADQRQELEAQSRFLRETFDRYLSGSVVEQLLESPGGLALGGDTRKVTILMTDLRGFTALSERLAPARMVELINNYLDVMTAILVRHHGTIDEFIGDAILAIFGAPQQRPDDAERAVACALEMQLAMAEVNAKNRRAGLPEVEMGIGLNTGEVAVGNIGSHVRAKYGVVGGAVNLAARIESYTTGGQVLVSQSTLDEAGPGVIVGETMEVRPKGVKEPIEIHCVVGMRGRHEIRLPASPLVARPPRGEITVRFTELDGKDAGAAPREGRVVLLSRRGAEIAAACAVPPYANLKLAIEVSDGAARADDMYAKVIPRAGVEGTFAVRFTSLPADAEALVEAALSGGCG